MNPRKHYPNMNPSFSLFAVAPSVAKNSEEEKIERIFKHSKIRYEYKEAQFSHALYEMEIDNKIELGRGKK